MNVRLFPFQTVAPVALAAACFLAQPTLADGLIGPSPLAEANTAFAFDLFKAIAGGQSGNIFISPYSVSSVLQIVDSGAAGQTRQEMDRVLHLNGLPGIAPACKSLDDAIMAAQDNVSLDLANSIWYQQGSRLKPDFSAECTTFFRAKTAALDFSSSEAARVINDWASQSTRGLIKNVIQPPIDRQTRIILANAIYFKGRWAREFDKNLTKERPFNLLDGTQRQMPMMQQAGHFRYYETAGFQAACLPYVGGRLQMCLFLPTAGTSLKQMLEGLDGPTWRNAVSMRFSDHQGTVVLPRFKLDYAVVLNEPLQSLGMMNAFSPGADFSAMSSDRLFLSEVKQKSFVDVSETGTDAAAVTTVTMHASVVLRPQAPFEMVLDHPFVFLIADQAAQTILFMGIVANPGA